MLAHRFVHKIGYLYSLLTYRQQTLFGRETSSLTTAANSVDSNESELVASNGDGADTPESPAASIEPPKKKAKVVPTKSQKTLKKASKLAEVYAANMHARKILVHSSEHKAKLLQADKLEKELQKVKDRVVELEEEMIKLGYWRAPRKH